MFLPRCRATDWLPSSQWSSQQWHLWLNWTACATSCGLLCLHHPCGQYSHPCYSCLAFPSVISFKNKARYQLKESYKIVMKLIKDDTDEMIYHIVGLEESMMWKWLQYPKQPIVLMQSYQISNDIFHRIRIKQFTICMETQKTPNSQNYLEKERHRLDESGSLISDDTTKLQ